MDTIFALATSRGKAGVAIIRVSGPASNEVCDKIAGYKPAKRSMKLCAIRDQDGNFIDRGLVLYFPEGESFTGEAVVELQLHGSPAVIDKCIETLSNMSGLRLAEAGEFTRRALLNGRMDLAQVEGLADLIEAETESQRVQAVRVFEGDLGELVEGWRIKLIRACSLIEVTIDFADEDVPVDVTDEVRGLIEDVRAELRRELAGSAVAERIREGFDVVILGPPNIGKSTLLNRLAGRDAAITSAIAGTTRDIVEVRMDLGGIPVTFVDTAGLRETTEEVEALGIGRAKQRAEQADLRIFLLDAGDSADLGVEVRPGDLVRFGKGDTQVDGQGLVSGKTGLGVDGLIDEVTKTLASRVSTSSLIIRERHRSGMERGLAHLDVALTYLERGSDTYELVAEELRQASLKLEELIGRVGTESLLDEIFSSFCLGK